MTLSVERSWSKSLQVVSRGRSSGTFTGKDGMRKEGRLLHMSKDNLYSCSQHQCSRSIQGWNTYMQGHTQKIWGIILIKECLFRPKSQVEKMQVSHLLTSLKDPVYYCSSPPVPITDLSYSRRSSIRWMGGPGNNCSEVPEARYLGLKSCIQHELVIGACASVS